MKDLVIDCRMIEASGIGTYISNVLPGLIKSGQFNIICLGNRAVLSLYKWSNQVEIVEFTSKIFSIGEQIGFFKTVPRCDIIWFPQYNTPFFKIQAKKRITTVHDLMHFRLTEYYSLLARRYLGLHLKNAISKSSALITVSEFTKMELIQLFNAPKAKLNTIHLSVDANFNTGIVKKETLKYVLYVGNVKPHKNLLFALKAFEQSGLNDHNFYIVGKKEGFFSGESTLEKKILDLGDRVFFTGFVSDDVLKEYYANANLFLFPSKYEGFGLPLLEAMKFNIPILSSDAASLKEVGGNAVFYFNPADLDSLIGLLNDHSNSTLTWDYDKYKENLSRFSWEKTIEKHIKLFLA